MLIWCRFICIGLDFYFFYLKSRDNFFTDIKSVSKGGRWMPRLREAMKDVISCEKLRVGANNL